MGEVRVQEEKESANLVGAEGVIGRMGGLSGCIGFKGWGGGLLSGW